MALSIKTEAADRLARELAAATGETLTDAVTNALLSVKAEFKISGRPENKIVTTGAPLAFALAISAASSADGYKMFAPQIKNQPQYHFTNKWNAIRNQFGFDPARPTSLLYKKDEQGRFHLIGAMYTASKRTSEGDLNDRVPLSVAHWHRHVNWCIPARNAKERWTESKNGRPVFGPLGVATKDECKAADGRFLPQAFGWMVHANTFAGSDLKSIWHDDHMDHDHAMMGEPKNPD